VSAVRTPFVAEGPTGPVPALLVGVGDAKAPRPLVLLGHGGGGSKDQPRMGQLAERFATALGAAVLLVDGPVHGQRAPDIDDAEERFRTVRRTLSDPATPGRMAEDWRAAIAHARGLADLADSPAGYVGFSMGTLLGVPTVAAIDEIRAAVFGLGGLVRSGGVPDVARAAGLDERVARIIAEEDDPEARNRAVRDAAVRLGDRQVLMLNMTLDEAFPVDGALELFALFPGPKRMALWEGGHLELPAEAIDLAVRFLARHLLGEGAPGEVAGAW
jgi:dienelactone hydrolase